MGNSQSSSSKKALAQGGKVQKRSSHKVNKTESFEEYYALGQKLAEGGFSRVHVGTNVGDQRTVAIKVVDRTGLNPVVEHRLIEEVTILKKIDHPNIIHYYHFFTEPKRYLLVVELCQGGELLDKIVKKKTYTEREARDLVKILLDAVCHLHEQQIVHRDLKPENLLLTDASTETSIKLADFGFATTVKEPGSLTGILGTPGYIAPEMLKGKGYGLEIDMWSIGVIIFILLGGYMPFAGKTQPELFARVVKGLYKFHSPNWDQVSDEAKDLISNCLKTDPKERLTARQALEHEWMHACPKELSANALEHSLADLRLFNARKKFRSAVEAVVFTNSLMKKFSHASHSTLSAESSIETSTSSYDDTTMDRTDSDSTVGAETKEEPISTPVTVGVE